MSRLNINRQHELKPQRMAYAVKKIEEKGYTIIHISDTELQFQFHGMNVRFFPYSGWASGISIIDGRGLSKLLKQI